MSDALQEELADLHTQFDNVRTEANELVAGLSEAQFNWRPSPKRWSIGGCIEHLNVTARLYTPRLEATIARAHERGITGTGPFKHGFPGNYFVSSAEPPVRRRFPAPGSFQPSASKLDQAEILAASVGLQDEFQRLLAAANGLHLAKVKIGTPAFRWLRVSLGQAFALTTAHERRHLWQADQVRQEPGFPSD